MNDAANVFERFFSKESNTVYYHGDAALVKHFADVFSEGDKVPFEAPDLYIKFENEIWIVEQFEFDCCKLNRKGSSFRREEDRIERFEKELSPAPEGTLYHQVINVESSYYDYVANVKKGFLAHYEKIANYKQNLLSQGIANSATSFFTVFLIEDVSPMGSSYVDEDGAWRPVVLAHSQEFLDLLSESYLVDAVLAVSCVGSEQYVWFIDRRQIDEYSAKAENYFDCRFLNTKPHVVGFQIPIPDNQR